MSRLTNKQRVFIEEYLQCWNATEAARRAGYAEKYLHTNASKLLENTTIQDEIEKRIAEKAMSADEALLRLGDMARGDIADFMDITTVSYNLNLHKAKEARLTKLIKKVKQKTTIFIAKKESDEDRQVTELEIELYSAKDALVHLGRHHKLFTDKRELTGADGGPIETKSTDGITDEQRITKLVALMDAAREKSSGEAT